MAALWAAPAVIDSPATLPMLAGAAGHWDHHVATTAALSARTIVRALTDAELEAHEISRGELDAWMASFAALATDAGVRNDVRVLCAEVALSLFAHGGSPVGTKATAAIAAAFRASPDPELARIMDDLGVLLMPSAEAP